MVEVGDGDGRDLKLGTVLGNGADESGTLGAEGESVAGIFDVGRCDDGSGCEQDGRTDAKAGEGRVSVGRGSGGGGQQRCRVGWLDFACGRAGGLRYGYGISHGGRFSVIEPGREGKGFKFCPVETDKEDRRTRTGCRRRASRTAGQAGMPAGRCVDCRGMELQEGQPWMI